MRHNVRNWHTWLSIAFAIPLLLVGLTTVFMAHEKALGTKEIMVPIGLMKPGKSEIRSSALIAGERWLGTKAGLYRVVGDKMVRAEGSPRDEIRDIVIAQDGLLLAGKKGLWRYQNGNSVSVRRGDCWDIAVTSTGYAAACKRDGLLISKDGQQWERLFIKSPEQAAPGMRDTPLSKIIEGIHTGELLFGDADWVWIDLLGLSMIGLTFTGLAMWLRGRRTRAGEGLSAGTDDRSGVAPA